MNKLAARFIGSIPEYYDRGLGPVLFSGWADVTARHIARLRPESVLELAASTGIVTRLLRDKLPEGCELVATDLSQPMLDIAQLKFQSGEHAHFEQMDAAGLQYADESFSNVVCQFGVMFFPDKERSHKEVLRVLKPAGVYCFTLWDSWEENPFARHIHDTVARFFTEEPPEFYKIPFSYTDIDEIKRLAESVGFSQVTLERCTLTVKIASMRDFAEGVVFGDPLYEEIIARGGDPEAVCAEIEATMRQSMARRNRSLYSHDINQQVVFSAGQTP